MQMYMTCHMYIHHCNYTIDLHILIHVTTLLLVATMRIIYYKAVIRTKKSTTNPFKAIQSHENSIAQEFVCKCTSKFDPWSFSYQ